MNIGEAARATGVSAKMIRHYEASGLIPATARTAAGYRRYGPADLRKLRFIRRARDMGFPMARIADLLALWGDRSRHSADVKRLATDQIADLQSRIRAMQDMVAALDHLTRCCAGDDRPDCPILNELGGDPATS
jgi:Cu(I)-responsive transcriptional regulator